MILLDLCIFWVEKKLNFQLLEIYGCSWAEKNDFLVRSKDIPVLIS